MNEPFLITVDCSKVLDGSADTQYTMFIDNSKMSIVYELVEWIRWMFTIEDCFYLTHQNSIIHELEDIQVLSKLKTFELKHCGQPCCVHKKLYRTLLNGLNLFVNWNEMKVHKYFLDKMSKIDKKFTIKKDILGNNFQSKLNLIQKSTINDQVLSTPAAPQFEKDNESESTHGTFNTWKCTVSKENFCEYKGTSETEGLEPNVKGNDESHKQHICDRKMEDVEESGLFELMDHIESDFPTISSSPAKKIKYTVNSSSNKSPDKEELKIKSASYPNNGNPKKSNRHVRPFSVGELLDNMRQEFKKQTQEPKSRSDLSNSSFQEKENGEEQQYDSMNSYVHDDFINVEEKKKKRIRKRKKTKKEYLSKLDKCTPTFQIEKNISLGLKTLHSEVKPNHIRFEVDEDNLMETDIAETKDEKETDICDEIKESVSLPLFNTNDVSNLLTLIAEKKQTLSKSATQTVSYNGKFKKEDTLPTLNQTRTDENLIAFNCDNCNIPKTESESASSHDLKDLLLLKDKFKSAVVIERFN